MAKSREKAEKTTPESTPDAQSTPAPATSPQRVEVDESDVQACYANFCRVNGTPEELIIDFGLNAHPTANPNKPLKITQRLVVNHFTAKRLLAALQLAIQRHEGTFGVVETNVQKRVLPQAVKATESTSA